MTLSPTISRWSFLVFFSVLLHLSHAYLFPLSKKTSSRFLFFSAFPASNSLQIFQQIPCKSLWYFTCLVSWGDKCFHCDELGHTGLFPSVQPNPFGATEAHNSVLPISLQERQLATYSCIYSAPAQLNDSCALPASYSTCYFALRLKDQTLFEIKIQKSPSWKLMSKGEREITSKLNHFYRGRKYSGRERPQMLGVQEERSHMSLRGERHVHIWLFALALFLFFALIFCSLSSPNIPCKIQGEQDI